ncbi:MAG: hypothetical protein A2591_03985 [Candidatus Yonathbacteria bacterium RIFOXYD1_FULL_52_36]|uniref:Fibronectin type-III domain-containing protein n=1 Tax=Candidatus Yonathbacteria bacterium RIFOXYD1_FULL_52_36 TaxID=1802730 RepID=A0A1G2SKE1_9BACT|nr:MAG: hypothetical protein A2591_03985 [Candidatus Yonathbacteria bacterium RIFOXYD1_FULL_52_36]
MTVAVGTGGGATMKYSYDFENGLTGLDLRCESLSNQQGRYTIQSQIVRAGSKALKIVNTNGTQPGIDQCSAADSFKHRAEIYPPDRAQDVTEGLEHWHGFSHYYTAPLPPSSNTGYIIWQTKHGAGGPELEMTFKGDSTVSLGVQSGSIDNDVEVFRIPVQLNTWNDWVIRQVRSWHGDGILEVWLNGRKLALVNLNGNTARPDSSGNDMMPSTGSYYGPEDRGDPDYTIYIDNFKYAQGQSAYALVDPAQGGGTSDTTAPTTPTSFTATAISTTQINLAWTASTDAVGVAGYRLERCTGATCTTFTQVATPTGATYSNTGLTANTTYRFRTRATDAAGNLSAYSTIVNVTTQSATTPTPTATLSANPTSITTRNSTTLTWSSTNATSCSASNGWTGAKATSGTQTLSPTTNTTYTISCTGAGGSIVKSVTVAVGTGGGATMKYSYDFENGLTGLDLRCESLSNQQGRYTIQSQIVRAGSKALKIVNTNGTQPGIDQCSAADSFKHRAEIYPPDRAQDVTEGLEHWHGFSHYYTAPLPPSSNTGYIIWQTKHGAGGPELEMTFKGDSTVSLGVQSGSIDNDVEVFRIPVQLNTWNDWVIRQVRSWHGDGILEVWLNGRKLALVNLNGNTARPDSSGNDMMPSTGSYYGPEDRGDPDYTIYIDNFKYAQGQSAYALVDPAQGGGTSDTTAPTTPTSFTATAISTTQINLAWTASTDAVGVAGYRLERCTGATCTTFTQVATPTGATYSNTGLTANTTYRFRTRATDAAGNLSAYSSIVNAVTQNVVVITPSTKFSLNDRVKATANLNVRTAPTNNTAGTLLGTQPLNAEGTVIGGPLSSVNSAGETIWWWNVNYDTAPDGWSYELYLEKPSIGTVYTVSSVMQFNSRAGALLPGDELVVKNGIYTDWDLNVSSSGSVDVPIIIRAETPGGVTFGGASRIIVNGRYVNLSGLAFKGVLIAPIIDFRGGNGRITTSSFISSGAATSHSSHVVRVQSSDNRVDNNYFEDCLSKCAGIWDPSSGTLRNRFDHNTFKNLRRFGQEEVEAIQIGQQGSQTGNSTVVTNTVIENNLFDNASGTAEIVSIKSSGVIVRYNTFLNSIGQLTLRSGQGNRVEGNNIIGSRNGISVSGPDHVIINNLIVNSEQSGIRLNGLSTSGGNGHVAADNTLVANNTIVGFSENGIVINPSDSTPPTGISVLNNLITGSSGTLLSVSIENSVDHTIRKNLLWISGSAKVGYSGTEAILKDPLIKGTGAALTISSNSPAVDGALAVSQVSLDRHTTKRPSGAAPDIGSDEYVSGTTTPAPTATLTASPLSVTTGNSTTLTWSSTNATSCTASGAWSGTKATSGTQTLSPTANTTYTLTCTGAGGTTTQSATVTVTAATDTTAPTTPTNPFAGAISTSQINLSWSVSTDNVSVTGYRLERCTGATCTTFAQIAAPSIIIYSDTNLTAGTTYRYRVRATDAAGNLSTYSSIVSATTQSIVTPTPTLTLSASPLSVTTGNSTTLTWSGTNATTCTASGAWFGTTTTSGSQTIVPAASTTYTLTCTGAGGSIAKSVSVSVTAATDTTAPRIVSATVSNTTATGATITLTASEPVTATISYGTSSNSLTTTATSNTAGTTHVFDLTNLTRKTAYFYQLSLRDAAGNTTTGPVSSLTTSARSIKPPKVQNVTATEGSVILTWTNPTYEYTRDIRIYRKTNNGTVIDTPDSAYLIATLPTGTTTYTDTAVAPNTRYVYTIFTYDDQSAYSEPASLVFTTSVDTVVTTPDPETPALEAPSTVVTTTGGSTTTSAAPSTTAAIPAIPATPTTPTTSTPPTTHYQPLTRALTLGSRGDDVTTLQQMLAQDPTIYQGEITGYYGPLTQAAVERFQIQHAIVSSGSPSTTGYGAVGPSTRAQLNTLYAGTTTTPPTASGLTPEKRALILEQIRLLQEQVKLLLQQLTLLLQRGVV